MAIKWGNIITGSKDTRKGKIGIDVTVTSTTNTNVTVTIKVYFASMYSLSDTTNSFYYTKYATSASNLIGSKSINHTVNTGSGWSSSNQTLLATYTDTVSRTTSVQTKNYAAKITGLDNLGASNVSSVYGSASIPALPSYTVTFNANGGSGAPSAQTKWYGTNLTLSSTKPTRTGYTFQGWGTSSTSTTTSYSAGGSYTGNFSATLYAVWKANTYTVSYNANGGTGAPASQTKTYGVDLTLSSTKPTRTNYNFKGWATSSTGSVVYAAGAKYVYNTPVTLYAVWELAYTKPRISGFSVTRCTSDGTASDEGTYALVKCNWATDKTVTSITIQWALSSASSWTNSTTVTASGTSGSVSKVIGSGAISTDYTHDVKITVADSNGSNSNTTTLPGTQFIIDILGSGNGVAFGKPAEYSGYMDVGYKAQFNDAVQIPRTPVGGNVPIALTSEKESSIEEFVPAHPSLLGSALVGSQWWNVISSRHRNGWADGSNYGMTLYSALTYSGTLYWRQQMGATNGWSVEKAILDSNNYSTYVVPKEGGTFSGNVWYTSYGKSDLADGKAGTLIGGNGTMFLQHASYPEIRLYGNGAKTDGGGMALSSGTNLVLYGKTNVLIYNSTGHLQFYSDRFKPNANDLYYLGDSGSKWKAVYAVSGTIQTSDRNQKDNIVGIGQKYEELFHKLQPVTFELKGSEHDRVHIGFVSQDVKESMDEVGLTDKELSAYCVDIKKEYDEETGEEVVVLDENGEPVKTYSLRYSEFIALNTHMIQKANAKIEAQQTEIDALKKELSELKDLIRSSLS